MTAIQRPRLAVLIDAENACAAHVSTLMDKISTYGKPAVRHAYGDWTTMQLTPWKKVLSSLALKPRQQFRHGRNKNSTDAALIIDAMDLLHSRCVDGFCIVSSDCDFTALASRIQQAGLLVYGFGRRDTMQALVAACDEFVFIDELSQQASGAGGTTAPGPEPGTSCA